MREHKVLGLVVQSVQTVDVLQHSAIPPAEDIPRCVWPEKEKPSPTWRG